MNTLRNLRMPCITRTIFTLYINMIFLKRSRYATIDSPFVVVAGLFRLNDVRLRNKGITFNLLSVFQQLFPGACTWARLYSSFIKEFYTYVQARQEEAPTQHTVIVMKNKPSTADSVPLQQLTTTDVTTMPMVYCMGQYAGSNKQNRTK